MADRSSGSAIGVAIIASMNASRPMRPERSTGFIIFPEFGQIGWSLKAIHSSGARVVSATKAEPHRQEARLRDGTYAVRSHSKLNVSVISGNYRFAMMERANDLRDKAARLRGYARLESDPGVCRALLTRAGDCESLAMSLEDNLEAGGRRPAVPHRAPRYA